ncbi:hypothetical protein ACI51W_03410 [Pseudomonas marginalis]|uniref:hypothetical protein n=1 Tax=Pseudomonas marginalis TaxID=298 RepID=UPI00386B0ABB
MNKITFRDKIKRIIFVKEAIKSLILTSVTLPTNVNSIGKNFIVVERSTLNYPFITQELKDYGRKFSRFHTYTLQVKGSEYKFLSGRIAYGKEARAYHYKAAYYLPAVEKLKEILAKAEAEIGASINITQTMPDEHLIVLEKILLEHS